MSDHIKASEVSAASDSGEDFAAMLDQYGGGTQSLRLQEGDKVQAQIIHISGSNVFCSLSATQEATLPLEEILDKEGKLTVRVGDKIDVFVVSLRDGIELRRKVGRDAIDVGLLMQARETGMPIDGLVTGLNKGGIEVSVGGARAFCPMGQVDVNFVEHPEQLVGQTLQFQVREVRENGRNVVLSRRALLEAERKQQAAQTLATLTEGARVAGRVTRLVDFGAFVDLGGIEGLVPMSELSYSRVEKVQDILEEGQQIEVEVRRIEDDPKRTGKKRIGLSFKATQPEPFEAHASSLTEGVVLEGTVVKLAQFGAFVELFPGVQGLVHISELSQKRVRHPGDAVSLGDAVSVRVLGVDHGQKRISLSIKQVDEPDPRARETSAAPVVGDVVRGTVTRIERYGVFVDLGGGHSGLLPAIESGASQGTDLNRAFPVGSEVEAVVINVDDRGRLKISRKAREAHEERAQVQAYNRSQGRHVGGFGTLGDLIMAKKSNKR